MRVKLFSTIAGPAGVFAGGQIHDLPDPLARALVEANAAEAIDPVEDEAPEFEDLEGFEVADAKPKRGRPRSK